ncbi:hypothetical protein PMAYCL1PPCAC_06098, partial [Pristionchus mayeri]
SPGESLLADDITSVLVTEDMQELRQIRCCETRHRLLSSVHNDIVETTLAGIPAYAPHDIASPPAGNGSL